MWLKSKSEGRVKRLERWYLEGPGVMEEEEGKEEEREEQERKERDRAGGLKKKAGGWMVVGKTSSVSDARPPGGHSEHSEWHPPPASSLEIYTLPETLFIDWILDLWNQVMMATLKEEKVYHKDGKELSIPEMEERRKELSREYREHERLLGEKKAEVEERRRELGKMRHHK